MRLMYDRFAKKRAFTGPDIERAISEVCQCNVRSFFDDHVRRAKPIDFNRLLASLGLRVALATSPVADTSGARFPDLRITAYAPPAGGRMRVRIMDPRTVWTSAGIHTGMEWGSLNRIQIDSFPDFRRAIRSIRLGDVVPVEVFVPGDGTPRHLTVSVRQGQAEMPPPIPLATGVFVVAVPAKATIFTFPVPSHSTRSFSPLSCRSAVSISSRAPVIPATVYVSARSSTVGDQRAPC